MKSSRAFQAAAVEEAGYARLLHLSVRESRVTVTKRIIRCVCVSATAAPSSLTH